MYDITRSVLPDSIEATVASSEYTIYIWKYATIPSPPVWKPARISLPTIPPVSTTVAADFVQLVQHAIEIAKQMDADYPSGQPIAL